MLKVFLLSSVRGVHVLASVHVCMCVHLYVCVCACIFTCVHVRASLRVCMCVHLYVCACACILMCVHVCATVRVCMCACVSFENKLGINQEKVLLFHLQLLFFSFHLGEIKHHFILGLLIVNF